jgi:uncharacterized protein with FMN-binding domain
MSGTKIVVVQLKELIKNTILVILGLALVIMLIYFFMPTGNKSVTALYNPGTYKTQITLDESTLSVDVTVSENEIISINLDELNEIQTVFYPLLKPTMASLTENIIKNQSLSNVTIETDQTETSKLLLYTIELALEKAFVK